MLGFMSNDSEVGFYSAGMKLIHMINGLFPAMIIVIFPRGSYYFANNDKKSVLLLSSKTVNCLLCFSLPVSVGLFLLMHPLVLLFCGVKYIEAISISKIMCPYLVFFALGHFLGGTILVAHGKEKQQLYSMIAAGLLDVVLNVEDKMKIALVGYGKMGHMIESCAKKAGHEIVTTIDVFADDASVKVSAEDKSSMVRAVKASGAEGIIEFTHPSSVIENIKALLPLALPLVVGTTGWNEQHKEIDEYAKNVGGTLMTAGNFSIGVNMFYKIVEEASKIMSDYSDYDVATWEAHHNQKADSPSGTALEIARRVMKGYKNKTEIITDAFHERPRENQLHVSSTRCGNIPGTHKVFFDGTADTIELTHTARSREGFAVGAVESLVKLDAALKSGRLVKGRLYGWEDLF